MKLPQFLPRLKKPKLFLLRKVVGESMAPALAPGRVLFAVPACKVKPGDVVIVHHDGLDKVKRIREIENGTVFLTGDNLLHSTDSRDFGWLDSRQIVAKVVWPNVARTDN